MTANAPSNATNPNATANASHDSPENTAEKILCPHCRRTATNGVKCKGICVADNDY